jgi:hypothetical protein
VTFAATKWPTVNGGDISALNRAFPLLLSVTLNPPSNRGALSPFSPQVADVKYSIL